MMENESLKSKVILLPQTDRGFKYARWKYQPAIESLRSKGFTSSHIQQELKIIHNLSCAAYYRSDTVCNTLSLQILAGFALSLSSISFIVFVTALLIFALYDHLQDSIEPEHYEDLTLYIMEHITPRSTITVCSISTIICISFGVLGAYIIYKSHRNKLNQYIECILAVHEHIYSRLAAKYEEHGIQWKIITHKKDSKRITMMGSKQDITYYGIVIKLKDDNDEEYNDDEIDVDLHEIQSIKKRQKRRKKGSFKKRYKGSHHRMEPSNSDMSINEDYYDRDSKLNQKHDERKLVEHMRVCQSEPLQDSWNENQSSSIFSRNNSSGHAMSRHNSSNHRVRDRFLTDKTDKSLDDIDSLKVDHVPLLFSSKMSMSNVGSSPQIIGTRIKLTD